MAEGSAPPVPPATTTTTTPSLATASSTTTTTTTTTASAAAPAAANADVTAAAAPTTGGGNKKKKKKKKRRKKSKPAAAAAAAAAEAQAEAPASAISSADAIAQLLKKRPEPAKPSGYAHKFWSTQPVLDLQQNCPANTSCAVDKKKTPDDIQAEPLRLPRGFEWSTIDITNPGQMREVYTLLTRNYVEDDDCMFRFDYSEDFLLWALTPPEYKSAWHVGVRQSSNKKLLGFITGVPARVCVKKKDSLPMAEINFLCVHKKLRAKRLAPVLIKEVTRRVNREDQWQAVYTAGVVLPKPIARCRYWHRSLNPKKLIAVGFSRIGPRMTMHRTIRLYKLPDTPRIPNIQSMKKQHVESCHKLMNEYLSGFDLHIEFSPADVAHWLLPRERVVDTFVVCDPSGKVTDLCSFYHLPSSIINHEKYKTLNAAYSFYNIAKTVALKDLMRDCLTMAKMRGCDVFNALDIMDNNTIFKELKFGIGDGHLQYYIYNWQTPEMKPEEVGLVLL